MKKILYTIKRHNLSFYFFMTSPPTPLQLERGVKKVKLKLFPFKIYILLVLLVSCEKPAYRDISPVEDNRIVVDGIITNEMKSHKIILSKINTVQNDSLKPVTGAVVQIKTSDTIFNLTENPVGSGKYITDSTTIGLESKIYEIYINYNGNIISGSDIINPVLPIPIATWTKENNSNLYHFKFICNSYNNIESAMYILELDWSNVSGYTNLPSNKNHATLYYYSLQSVDLGELLGPKLETVLFPIGTKVIEKKYSLSLAHAEFIRSMLLETQWSGGLFDAPHSNVTSNLKGDAVGFFGASAVVTRTFLITP